MSRFASKDIIAVSADDDPRDVIYIYAQANMGMERRINKRFLTMKSEAGSKPTLSMDPTEYNFATLCEFIDRWEGPGFVDDYGKPVPFSEKALEEIEADDPHLTKVLKTIQERNPRFADEDEGQASPNSEPLVKSDGSESLQAPGPSERANGTRTSASRKGSVGTLA